MRDRGRREAAMSLRDRSRARIRGKETGRERSFEKQGLSRLRRRKEESTWVGR